MLRFVAVLLVLFRHAPPAPPETAAWAQIFATMLRRGGWVGVDLFFVLSGFLVSGLLFREYQRSGAVRAGRFLARRGFKIYPSFWALIALTALLGAPMWDELRPPHAFASELLFVQNYFVGLWSHTWSLAVEEHFYFALAAFVAWRARRGGDDPFRVLPALFVAVAAGCLTLRFAGAGPFELLTHHVPTHLRIDSLLFGALLAYGWHFGSLADDPRIGRTAPALGVAGCGALALPFVFPLETTPWMHTVGYTLLYLGAGAVVVASLRRPAPRFPGAGALAWIGAYSYAIYLWHLPVLRWGSAGLQAIEVTPGWASTTALYFVASILGGIAMSEITEQPLLRVRERWVPSPSGVNAMRRGAL